nr:uncharacterized protein LOC112035328 [Quercus suber]
MVVNPRENASAILLRSGKEVEISVKVVPTLLKQENEQNVIADKNAPSDDEVPKRKFPPLSDYKPVPPFPQGNTQLEKAMLDLGASINIMPHSIYASLKLGPLNKTSVAIQLADRSIAYPKGVVEDVLVQVNDLVFPADFYVLDMENDDQTTPILLGRPFLKISKTKID